MTEYWKNIAFRLHEESALHYPQNRVARILSSYLDGTLNEYEKDQLSLLFEGFLIKCSGVYLDERGAELGLQRVSGKFAKGVVTFKLLSSAKNDVIIKKGTNIRTKDTGWIYILQEDVIIPKSKQEASGIVRSQKSGSFYNTSSNTLTEWDNSNYANATVTNPNSIMNGEDIESDKSFRQRILNSISTYLSVNFIKDQGVLLYSKNNLNENIRMNMTSNNPYMNNIYAAIPKDDVVKKFLETEIVYEKHLQIYKKGWE